MASKSNTAPSRMESSSSTGSTDNKTDDVDCNFERGDLFYDIENKDEEFESVCGFRYSSSKRIVEIIKMPWDLWRSSEKSHLARLPAEIMSKIGQYISSEEQILIYKSFGVPWFTSSEELAIKILKECIESLKFASHPTLMLPTNTFDPQPRLPSIDFYRTLGTSIDRKIENFDAKIKLFQHYRTTLRKNDKYKYETFAINDHSFKLCLHCVVPAIIIDDILENTNLRRRQSLLSISNVEFNSGPLMIEFDCENCIQAFALNAMQKSQFNLYFQLPITGCWDPRLVTYSNFITSEKLSWISKRCYVQINGTGNLKYESLSYNSISQDWSARLPHQCLQCHVNH